MFCIPPSHIILTSSANVQAICQPLFDFLNITNFDWVRTYDDGKRTRLTTHPEWVVHYFQKEYYKHSKLEKHSSLYRPGFCIWDYWERDNDIFWKIYKDMSENFDRSHGLTIKKVYQNYSDNFVFTTSQKNNINSLYASNIDVLNKFTVYFMDKAINLIDKCEKNLLYCPVENNLLYSLDNSGLNKSQRVDDFYNKIKLQKINLKIEDKIITLSEKQLQCALYLMNGCTAKEIARIISISPRTVESYIKEIKNKLNCQTRSDIYKRLSFLH